MKKKFITRAFQIKLYLIFLLICGSIAKAQIHFYATINNQEYEDGTTVYIPCSSNSNSFIISARYYENGSSYNMQYYPANQASAPAGYTLSNFGSSATLVANYTNGHDGNLMFNANVGGLNHTYNFPLRSSPIVNPFPAPSLGQNSGGFVQVSANYSGYSYSSITWNTNYGLRVYGGTSYTAGNSGGNPSAYVTTGDYGGVVTATLSNACGTSTPIGYFIGTPYISQKYFDGVPCGSNITTNNTSGSCSVSTDNQGTSATWTKVGGSGNFTPSGFSCTVVPTNYIRMSVQVFNGNGPGQSDIFMVTKAGFRGYSMPYPNPTKDQITVDFEDAEFTDYMLNELTLYDSNHQVARQFDVKEAKNKKYFQSNKQVVFSVKGLKKGIYFLKIMMGEETESNQIIIE